MNRPSPETCLRTYRHIQAHCAIRRSARVGNQLRQLVGATGEIAEMAPAALQTKFTGADFDEALRLVTLARYIKAKYSRGGDHVQAQA